MLKIESLQGSSVSSLQELADVRKFSQLFQLLYVLSNILVVFIHREALETGLRRRKLKGELFRGNFFATAPTQGLPATFLKTQHGYNRKVPGANF
jgi:hypothetical protein